MACAAGRSSMSAAAGNVVALRRRNGKPADNDVAKPNIVAVVWRGCGS